MKKPKRKELPPQNLTPEEQAFEDTLDFSQVPPTPAERLEEIQGAMARSSAARGWGGSRPGAGRPPKDRVKKHLSLTSGAAAALDMLVERSGLNQSDTVSRVLEDAAHSGD